jgi:hypothetical protein
VLRFQRRIDTKPFFERNRDQLVMMIISAIVGGLLTFAASKIKDQIFPASEITKAK